MTPLRVLDLFSGIGGFSLGLERTGGFRTVGFCEIDPYCRKVLAKHWPDVRCYPDVTTLTAAQLAADGIAEAVGNAAGAGLFPAAQAGIYYGEESAGTWHAKPQRRGIDVICGGFPCQDISLAGKGAGIEGERSGLWSEYARLIGEIRPRYAIVENVTALLGRGLATVLGDLAALGYDAEWHCIPASAVGAPHRRDRIWIVADAGGEQHESNRAPLSGQIAEELSVADASAMFGTAFERREPDRDFASCGKMAHPDLPRLEGWLRAGLRECASERASGTGGASGGNPGWWRAEPDVGRVAHGVPQRVDRLKALGNAVVPQIPELIGRAILARETAA